MIAQDINQYKSYSHANSNSYVLTCTITCEHTLYTCIRILNCKLTFVWQSGQCRKSTLPTVHNCCLGSTRSVGRPGQGPPETPTTLQLHDGTADIVVGMEQGNTTNETFEGELYMHVTNDVRPNLVRLHAGLMHIKSHRHTLSKRTTKGNGKKINVWSVRSDVANSKFIIFRELYS